MAPSRCDPGQSDLCGGFTEPPSSATLNQSTARDTVNHFTDTVQIEEITNDDWNEEFFSSLWEDDQALEEFCLECVFGPEE